jgi:hypothetical protein
MKREGHSPLFAVLVLIFCCAACIPSNSNSQAFDQLATLVNSGAKGSNVATPDAESLAKYPLPFPLFIMKIQPSPGSSQSCPCHLLVFINEGQIWEPGNTPELLDKHYVKHTKLHIDGRIIPLRLKNFGFIASLIGRLTTDGKLLGTHGSGFLVGVELDLQPGLHTAKIEIPSTSGKVFSYEWAFYVVPPSNKGRNSSVGKDRLHSFYVI